MAGKRAQTLLDSMLFIELYTLNRAWDDLTDDELRWEPLEGSWNVHRADACPTPTPFLVGDWAVDFDADLAWAASEGRAIEPLTTIAWLFWHIGTQPARLAELDFLGGERTADSGWTSPYIASHPVFTRAADAVEAMRAGWRSLDLALQGASDEPLEAPTRFWGYGGEPGPPTTGAQIIASVLNEVSHHGTQICALRDLYRLVDGRPLRLDAADL
jgi:DinB superfamily